MRTVASMVVAPRRLAMRLIAAIGWSPRPARWSLAGGLWSPGEPIADRFPRERAERRGVQATYTLDRVGLRTQQISNIVIGDPQRPDLTAALRRVQMRIKWNGSVEVYRIVARGVRLRGRLVERPGQLGPGRQIASAAERQAVSLARLRRSTSPTPRIALDNAATAPSGFAVARARAILPAGSRAGSRPRARGLIPGKCTLDRLARQCRCRGEFRRGARTCEGRLTPTGFDCPQSRIAMVSAAPRIDSQFSEAFASFDGKGGWRSRRFDRRRQWPCAL